MSEKLIVGIADMKMAQNSGTIITYALGSCVGISLYEPMKKICALVHILLPLNMEMSRNVPFKYANTGIAEALKMMERRGAARALIKAKIAGGACMFETMNKGGGSSMNVGQRNIESVRMCLRKEGIMLQAENVGGTKARTMSVDVATGTVSLKSYGLPDITL